MHETHRSRWERPELDSCGIGFVADAAGRVSRAIVELALTGLACVRHRGAIAADGLSGDGAGLLIPIPRRFFARVGAQAAGAPLDARPDRRHHGVPRSRRHAAAQTAGDAVAAACAEEGIELVGWRAIPIDETQIGGHARDDLPAMWHAFMLRPDGVDDEQAERRAFRARRRAEAACREAGVRHYFASWSFSTRHVQGARDQRPAGGVLSRSRRRRLRRAARDLPQPLLDQHHAGMGARPAVPPPVPQRRDQHRAGQRAPHGRARCARHRGGRARTRGAVPSCSRSRRLRLGQARRDRSSCSCAAGATCVTRRDDSCPRRGRASATSRPACATSSATTRASAIRGTARPGSSSPTDGASARASTATGCARCAGRPATTASSCARRRVGAVPVAGHGAVRRGRLGPGEMLCVDPDRRLRSCPHRRADDTAVKRWLARRAPYAEWAADGLPSVLVGQAARRDARARRRCSRRQGAVRGDEGGGGDGAQAHGHRRQGAHVLDGRRHPVRDRVVAAAARLPLPEAALRPGEQPADRPPPRAARDVAAHVSRPASAVAHRGTRGGAPARAADVLPLSRRCRDAARPAPLAVRGRRASTRPSPSPTVRPGSSARSSGSPIEAERRSRRRTGRPRRLRRRRRRDPCARSRRCWRSARCTIGWSRAHCARRTSLVVDSGDARDAHAVACLLGYGADAICPRLALETVAAHGRRRSAR